MKKVCLYIAAIVLLTALLTGCVQKSRPDKNSLPPEEGNGITSLNDLTGKSVGVSLGSGSDMLLTGDTRYALLRYDSSSDALMALKNNSVAAIAVEITTAREILKKNDGLSVISGSKGYENYGVVVAKGNTGLKNKVDIFIDYLKESGAYTNMVNRWIRTGADAIEMPEFVPKPGEVLRVGIDATYTPFEYFGENNELLGFDIEFLYKLAEFYGIQLEFYNSTFASLFTALDSNQVDLVISAVAITADRQERYTFSQIYYENEIVFVVKTPGNKQAIRQIAELSGKSIGVLSGTPQDVILTDKIPDALLFYYTNGLAELKSLRAKRLDAVAASDFGAELLSQNNADLTTLPGKTEYGQVAFATTYENAALTDKMNAVIQKLTAEGTLKTLHAKWFAVDTATKVEADIKSSGENGTIRFGVVLENNPYAYTDNTRTVGFDIDLIKRVAEVLNMKVDIIELETGKAIAALQTGKVDVIGGGLLITPEDAKSVRFSAAYDTAYTALVVLRDTADQKTGFWAGLSRSFYNNVIKEQRYLLITAGLWETVKIAFFSILAGTLAGGLVCALKRSKKRVLNLVSNVYIKLMQGIPVLVLLLIVCYVFFANISFSLTAIAVIAFGAYFAAYVCEILNSGLDSVDKGQREAAIALGYTKTQAFIKHILPQAVIQALPIYRGESISLIKNTSVVGFIAILDLTKASDIIRSRTYEAFFPLIMVAVIYFIIAWAMTYGLKLLEKRLDVKSRRRRVQV
jgi:polar amino acid transport system substrate-binding protein